GAAFCDVFSNVNRRHVEDAFADHGFQVFIGNVVAVLDGVDARSHRVMHALQRHGVSGDFVPLTVSFVHGGANLVESKRRNVIKQIVTNEIAAIDVELDPVGAV